MRMVGFDRRIRLEWLDEVAFYYNKTIDPQVCADHMYDYLTGAMPGHRTRRNIITILKRVWTEVPQEMVHVRDRGLNYLVSCNNVSERLAVHWGMIMSVYPFFRDVVELIGDMFTMQDEISMAQIYRRTVEQWGERSTVKHALEKLTGSLWQWGVLKKVKTGTYAAKPKLFICETNQLWLIECLVRSYSEREMPFFNAITSTALFPFTINISKECFIGQDYFELSRQGLNNDMISVIN